ncbi:hypothetical protein H5410_048594 [Solanum commersonii]|uniref:PB1-like domain-containing protein n=1 Tax=Solanum commersonii TaxID=4109 RepID=A0A9J5XM81_SOLCO|nr:hypothetical protein H5410_048594 [Solanum commersonii]
MASLDQKDNWEQYAGVDPPLLKGCQVTPLRWKIKLMTFTLITLRWYHGGIIEFGPPPKYIGGHVTEFLDVGVNRMSYFELRDYIKEL